MVQITNSQGSGSYLVISLINGITPILSSVNRLLS